MNYSGSGNHHALVPAMDINHPWIQERQVPRHGEQQIPSQVLTYLTQLNLLTSSQTQTRVVNHNYESIKHEHRTYDGVVVSRACLLTIPIELLDGSALPTRDLKEIVFLGPHPTWSQIFLNLRDDRVMRAIHFLGNVEYLEKMTFSLDLSPISGILEALAAIPGLEEIVLTPTTARALTIQEMPEIQRAVIYSLQQQLNNIKRLTFPMDFITPLLLSHLANLPCLESLTVKYCPPPPQHPFPAWSSYQDPEHSPGHIFRSHLNFDPRGRGLFKKLVHLELGVSSSDISYSALKKFFPNAHVC